MTRPLLNPCPRWAEALAAQPGDLSPAERAALAAHVATCPACFAVQADYQQMDVSIHSLAGPKRITGLPPRLLTLWQEERQRARGHYQLISSPFQEDSMHVDDRSGASTPAPTPIGSSRHHHQRRLVSAISAIAAIVVITLITTALLLSHVGKPTTTGVSGIRASTPTPGNSGWVSVPKLTNLAVQPIIAPSDPKVVYEADQHLTTFRRSDTGGATWHSLSVPNGKASVQYGGLTIDPNNAQHVFLDVTVASCPTGQASTGQLSAYAGGGGCAVLYSSTDSGAHWNIMHFPSGITFLSGGIIAQGNHLYAVAFDTNQNRRLIASVDGDANWQFADNALLTQGQHICSIAAPAAGSTVFAFVQAGACAQAVGYLMNARFQAQSSLTLWRSDDASAHWAQVSVFSYQQLDTGFFLAVTTRGAAQPTLYTAAGVGDTYTRLFSTDGGKTWQPLPSQGLPASQAVFDGPALSDGSSLRAVQDNLSGASSFYAWKPGDQAWHQVTPSFIGTASDAVVSSAGGHDTIWLVTSVNYTSDFTVSHYTLA